MSSLIINRLTREINEYYDNIQNNPNFRYMNKDNVKDTNFIIPPNDLLLLDQVDLVMINNAITRRKNRFIAIHIILSDTLIIPTETFIIPTETFIIPTETFIIPTETFIIPTETFIIPTNCIRNRNYIMQSYY